MDQSKLEALRADVAAGKFGNVHAVLIGRGGKLVFETYAPGSDWALGHNLGPVINGPDRVHDVRSSTKTVVSTLIGIAIARGEVPGIDTPIHTLLPRHAHLMDGPKRAITIRHLLTMSSGIEWHEFGLSWSDPKNDERHMLQAADPIRYILSRPIAAAPGAKYNYSGGDTFLLAEILKQQTGTSVPEYARKHLFGPLQIERYEWRSNFANGPNVAAGLRLTPRDYAKIGLMFHQQGRWHCRQIVPGEWIRQATAAHVQMPLPGDRPEWILEPRYGFQWWNFRYSTPKGPAEVPFVNGNGGQRIFLVPAHDLVVVTMGGAYYEPVQTAQILFRAIDALQS